MFNFRPIIVLILKMRLCTSPPNYLMQRFPLKKARANFLILNKAGYTHFTEIKELSKQKTSDCWFF